MTVRKDLEQCGTGTGKSWDNVMLGREDVAGAFVLSLLCSSTKQVELFSDVEGAGTSYFWDKEVPGR